MITAPMKPKIFATLKVSRFAACLCIAGCLSGLGGEHVRDFPPQDDPRKEINLPGELTRLKGLWEGSKIEKITILYIPKSTDFLIDISSAGLQADYRFKLILREPRERRLTQQLERVVEKVSGHLSRKHVDLRWGFIFEGPENRECFSIYLDRTGRQGVVNGACFIFDSQDLLDWADSTFGNIFQ
jgi:hypothetical protein